MPRPLVYLPGFNSGPQSEKSQQLRTAFPSIVVASYDTWNPDRGYAQLCDLIQPLLAARPLLVGSSLGGFWAYHLANQWQLSSVLINPCMTSEISLKPSIGAVQNFYTSQSGVLTAKDLSKYANYQHAGSAPTTVLHEQGDELIPYQESVANFADLPNAKLILPAGGNHRFTHMQLLLDEIRLSLNAGAPVTRSI